VRGLAAGLQVRKVARGQIGPEARGQVLNFRHGYLSSSANARMLSPD
jgi:hypothetical protein